MGSYEAAKEMYPILNEYDYKIVDTPNKDSPYYLEHFPPGEIGSLEMPRPKGIPLEEYGLQIFKDVRPEDIAGDIISHHIVNKDKYLSEKYKDFKNSVSLETMKERYKYHKENLNEERDFNSWSEKTGYPELLRGYVFKQFDRETENNLYSSEQKEILDAIKQYITKKPKEFAQGGSVEDQTDEAFGKKEIEPDLLNKVTDFFSRERGLERSEKLEDAIRYYLGPYAGSLSQANQLINPIVGLQDAGESTREGRYVDAITDTAAAGLPIAGALAARPLAKGVQSGIDKAVDAVTEVMTGMTFSKIDPYKIQQVINESNAVLSGANKKIDSKLRDIEGRLQQSPLGTLERKLTKEQMGKGKGKQNTAQTQAALNLGFNETGFHSTGKYDPSGEIEVFKLPDEVYAAKAAAKGITLKEAVQQYGGFQSFDNSATAHDFLGVHVGTTKAAADRHFSKSETEGTEGARTYQLALKTNKPFLDGKKPWTEKGLNTFLKKEMSKIKDGMVYEKMQIIRRRLAEQGYTHVPYINNVEDKRNISYAMLVDRPEGKGVNSSAVIRYKDAEFNRLEKSNRNAKFAQGGLTMNNQTQMAFALGGEAETIDPVSGNDVPPGSLPAEVRDDLPARLSEGEYVVPADVVRFFGVRVFEEMRAEAKRGLQQMEADGRIGGDPVPPMQMAQGPEQDIDAMIDAEMASMNSGGVVQGYDDGADVARARVITPTVRYTGRPFNYGYGQPLQAAAEMQGLDVVKPVVDTVATTPTEPAGGCPEGYLWNGTMCVVDLSIDNSDDDDPTVEDPQKWYEKDDGLALTDPLKYMQNKMDAAEAAGKGFMGSIFGGIMGKVGVALIKATAVSDLAAAYKLAEATGGLTEEMKKFGEYIENNAVNYSQGTWKLNGIAERLGFKDFEDSQANIKNKTRLKSMVTSQTSAARGGYDFIFNTGDSSVAAAGTRGSRIAAGDVGKVVRSSKIIVPVKNTGISTREEDRNIVDASTLKPLNRAEQPATAAEIAYANSREDPNSTGGGTTFGGSSNYGSFSGNQVTEGSGATPGGFGGTGKGRSGDNKGGLITKPKKTKKKTKAYKKGGLASKKK